MLWKWQLYLCLTWHIFLSPQTNFSLEIIKIYWTELKLNGRSTAQPKCKGTTALIILPGLQLLFCEVPRFLLRIQAETPLFVWFWHQWIFLFFSFFFVFLLLFFNSMAILCLSVLGRYTPLSGYLHWLKPLTLAIRWYVRAFRAAILVQHDGTLQPTRIKICMMEKKLYLKMA